MKKITLIPLICFLSVIMFGQSANTLLIEVKTLEQANKLIESYPKLEGKIFTISSDKDTSVITLSLFDKKDGYTFELDNNFYKIIENNSHSEFRASYIYLDGSQLTFKQIDSLRKLIITKFKEGVYFFDLIKEYTMDGNPTGDLGWFSEKSMEKIFEDAVKKHKKNDIFTVDIPEKKWYYVTFKTFDDRVIRMLTILKIKGNAD